MSPAIEDGAYLFEAIHMQPVGLIDDDEGSRVGDLLLASLIVLVSLKIDWVHSWLITGRASRSLEDFTASCLITKSEGFKHSIDFPLDWPHSNASQSLSCPVQVRSDSRWCVDDLGRIQDGIELGGRHRCVVLSIIVSEGVYTTVTSS
jgi:hypothetical protein